MEESKKILSGRRMVVTGAGRGLGRAIAIIAADNGADVVLLGRTKTALSLVVRYDRKPNWPQSISSDV